MFIHTCNNKNIKLKSSKKHTNVVWCNSQGEANTPRWCKQLERNRWQCWKMAFVTVSTSFWQWKEHLDVWAVVMQEWLRPSPRLRWCGTRHCYVVQRYGVYEMFGGSEIGIAYLRILHLGNSNTLGPLCSEHSSIHLTIPNSFKDPSLRCLNTTWNLNMISSAALF